MTLAPGTRLGPYEILAPLGAGGMGEVYRARDTKLKRDVALKVLPDAFASDPDRMARFQREAEVLASLNHPNIAHIYGVEDRALVMELVEGAEPRGPLDFDEAWNIASQIAAALEYAHDKGIVHRDLKPANIKITPEGVVKLLDFGLAKAFTNHRETSANTENSPTLTISATEAGVILGTAAYMAPEQAKGKSVDKRADIWAFGVVLYELLTGERLFKGDDAAEILAQVLTKTPDFTSVPAKSQPLLNACVQKDPKHRLRDIGDARYLLGSPQSASSKSRLAWIVASASALLALFLAILVGVLVSRLRETASQVQPVRSSILAPENASFGLTGSISAPIAISPDGHYIAFGATAKDGKRQLWIRSLESLAARPISGTELATDVFWSPDNRSLGFFAQSSLKKIDISGGPAVTLCDAPVGQGGSWNREGVIVFAPNRSGPLYRISAAGGNPEPITTLDTSRKETAHRWPAFLPDGRHFLYSAGNAGGNAGSVGVIRVGSLDSRGSDSKKLIESDFNAAYSQRYLLYLRDTTLMAAPFDPKALTIGGSAIPLAEQVRTIRIPQSRAVFSVSEAGALIYRKDSFAGATQLTWFDRHGTIISRIGEPAQFADVKLSPSGNKLISTIGTSPGSGSLWLYDVARGFGTRFTSDTAGAERGGMWSPDGKIFVFTSNRRGHFDIYQEPSDGSSRAELLYADNLEKYPSSVSPDGKLLLYYTLDSPGGANYNWVLPLVGDRKPHRLTQDALGIGGFESEAQFSPDGRWICYRSNESGRNEIYAVPFPGVGGKVRISEAGGTLPRWRRDGKELFYSAAGRLTSSEIEIKGRDLVVGKVHALFDGLPSAPGYSYDVSADGQRFLVVSSPEQNGPEPLTLVQNWTAALKK